MWGGKSEHHLGYYALFISFFPQLVAGPIERTGNLLPQLRKAREFDYVQAAEGMRWMLWGYFKKLLIADVISSYISKVYVAPERYQGFSLVITVALFSVQIYCDFSGYSDIAIGSAKILGINFDRNFKSPYFSKRIKDFWSNWHISLSTWFRDYVYIPLGGNHVGKIRHKVNLMLTFLLSGLWHGADWSFVIWGALHGVAQIVENYFQKKRNSRQTLIWKAEHVVLIFSFVTFAWIFFAANTLGDAFYIICHLFVGISNPYSYLHDGFAALGISISDLIGLVTAISLLTFFDILSLSTDVMVWISEKNAYIRWSIYIVLALAIVFFSQKGVAAEFVYFQF